MYNGSQTVENVLAMPETSLFGPFDEERSKHLFGASLRRTYPKNSFVLNVGDTSDSFYIILSGKIKITLPDEDGREFILSILGPGEHFGEVALLDGKPRSASAVTMEDSTLLVVSRDQFQSGIARHPDMAEHVLTGLTERLRAANRTIENLALLDVYSRIARTLGELAVAQDDGVRVVPQRLTHQHLANMVGASREMVTRILRDLTSGGYISIDNHHISILKPLPRRW